MAKRDRSAERGLRLSALVFGALLTLIGLVGVLFYVVGVVQVLVEQPADRSWLFWGLGVAGFGVTALGGGIVLLVVWWRMGDGRSDHVEPPPT